MRFLKILIPLMVLVVVILLAKYLLATGPKAKKKPFVKQLPVVEVVALKERSYTVTIDASGIVRAGNQTNLVSEVSGKVTQISDTFLEGSYFNKNQVLLQIDSSNYKNTLVIAESDVASNKASLVQLVEEQKSTKRSFQLAQKNLNIGQKEVQRLRSLWSKKLIARSVLDREEQQLNQLQQKREDLQGRLNAFSSRTLAIKAKTNASSARVKQEQLNLNKTVIKAPYSGRVFNKKVDVGQFVGTGTVLGKIYATDFVYVDLPLSLAKYELLNIPDPFQGQTVKADLPTVVFNDPSHNKSHNKSHSWQGRVVRSSAALDADSRQIKVIARIDEPFKASSGVSAPIKIGQYLKAKIAGKTFDHVYVLPPVAIRQNKELLLLKEGKVHIVPIEVLWNSGSETVVRAPEKLSGERLITTVMSQATEGMKVITVKQQREKNEQKEALKKTKRLNKKDEAENAKEEPEGLIDKIKGFLLIKSKEEANTKSSQDKKSEQAKPQGAN